MLGGTYTPRMAQAAAWYWRVTASMWADRALVAAVAVVGAVGVLVRESPALGWGVSGRVLAGVGALLLVGILTAGVLWWRRSRPLGVLAAALLGVVVAAWVRPPGLFSAQVVTEVMVACFAIGAWSRRPWASGAVLVLVTALLTAVSRAGATSVWNAFALGLAVVVLPAVAGMASRARRRYLHEVEQRLAEAVRDQDAQARRAVVEEQARIARELHDIVAHHVSLIGVQAGAARTALVVAPQRTATALLAIEASSRDAVTEMRRLLHALRPLDAMAVPDPQPGLHRLPELFASVRAAGFDLCLRTEGVQETVHRGLSLAVYRVVEEALTNVTRHSGARNATVVVRVDPDRIMVDVEDPGPIRPSDRTAGSPTFRGGRGLVGMSERVALYDGTLRCGPTPGGGFRVTAVMPRVGGPG